MAEFTRAMVSRLRHFVADRRNAKRAKIRLPFSLSIASAARARNGLRPTHSIDGHTLDISATGLALIVPAIRLGEHHLVGENRDLHLNLELPVGPVEMQVTPIRYETFEEQNGEKGYLIGVEITTMPDDDRARFADYVSTRAAGKV